jgi:chitodextrinase
VALAAPAAAHADPGAPGLVAAYSFDEGSGGVANDASGNGHFGTISGATWASGRYGGALSFNGTNASVLLGSLGTFYQSGFTLEAWVQKTSATKNDVAVVGTWAGSGPMIWVDHIATRYQLTLGGSYGGYLDSGANPVAGQWQHIAATYDGATARFYIDGSQVASRAFSGSVGNSDVWRIGAYGSSPGGFFDGSIDDVRVYDRALTTTEVQSDMDQPVSIANGSAPTMPGNFSETATTQTSISFGWNASTDNHGVSGYILYVDGAQAATTTATSFTFTGLHCSTSHQFGVEAYDASGNVSPRALKTKATAACAGSTGLVAAYAFDEGSGGVVSDASGNGHDGTVSGATWTAGHDGGALSFNGTNASVLLGSLGTFYQSGFTLEAWVQKTSATRNDAAVVGTWNGSGPMLWVDHLATHYFLTLGGSYSGYLDSGASPVAGQWQHIAATYDGSTARYYIDGSLVASRAVSGSVGNSDIWRIGAYGGSPWGFFDGLIDDVRIYDQARSGSQVQADMNDPVAGPDAIPPTAPGAPAAVGGFGQVALNWAPATDNVGVTRYAVHRSTTPGFTPSDANRIGQPVGTSFTDVGLAAGTYYYRVTAADGAGNVGPASSEASAVAAADTTAPTVAIDAPGGGSTLAGVVTVSAAADDDQGVVGVQFKLDGQNLGNEDTTSPYSLGWDTRVETNAAHTLTAVARDGAGNATTSAPVNVTVGNTGVSTTGLRLAYGFDEGGGTLTGDSSGNLRTGTFVGGASWANGRYGGGVSLDGSTGEVDPPALGTFYKTAFTYEAWVYKRTSKVDVGVVGSWSGSGGPMIWVDHISGHYRLTMGNSISTYLDSGRTPALGRWQHVAATYDGTTARFYVDGDEVANTVFTGNIGDSNVWRIGAYGVSPTGFFDGTVDDVRIYDRALSATEIADGMTTRIQPDTAPPAVTAKTPTDGATGVDVGRPLKVTFNEPMKASSITGAGFELRDSGGNVVPLSASYDPATNTAKLSLQGALAFDTTYTAVVKAGGAKDLAGNAVASDVSWSFTTPTTAPQVLLLDTAANPFSTYMGEILLNEGVDDYTTVDASLMTTALLGNFDLVLLGDTPLSQSQVSMLTSWVNGGGNLVAMHPDKQLAGLLGLTDAAATLSNAYLKVDTSSPPGQGIVGQTIQFHGTADRYTLNGATAVATLYSDANNATASPAVTLRSVGGSGGQAAAFTFDLARSVVLTRQGNPAWAGQERDGAPGIRPDDMFYGAKPGDVQPDWVDTNKIAIPQADEQQRLLVNLMTLMERDKMPLPHFWYLPRGKKAVVLLSGDDHSPNYSPGGTGSNFLDLESKSPPGCVIADWECVRATSYILQDNPVTNAQAADFVADGFEIGVHPMFGSCPTTPMSESLEAAILDSQLAGFRAKYSSLAGPFSNRNHCVYWPDWLSSAKIELASGMRMDSNYYHFPGSWIGNKPGFMTGGGFPMRFAELDGTAIDVYQQNTNLTDESTDDFAGQIATLLDNALGAPGYYGAFGTNIHTDYPAPLRGFGDIVAAAQARGVPLISYKQMLDWVDGRDASTIRTPTWNAATATFTFTTSVGAGAGGLQTMLPTAGPSGTLSALSCNGAPVAYTLETIKGVQYAMFAALTGTCQATYS